VGLSGEKSNQIFDELASWEEILKDSSLVDAAPATKAQRESRRIRQERRRGLNSDSGFSAASISVGAWRDGRRPMDCDLPCSAGGGPKG
jgi:hypothetical protein